MPACVSAANDDATPDPEDPAPASTSDTGELAAPSVRIVFAGGGAGRVDVSTQLDYLGSCFKTCVLPVPANQEIRISSATPSTHGGLSGACTSTGGTCSFTSTTGRSTLTATFTKAPGEIFTKFFDDNQFHSAAFDSVGRLVVASATQIVKLNNNGGALWTQPLAVCNLAAGPGSTIYAQTTTSVMKLAANGSVLWTQPLDANSTGCATGGHFGGNFVHNIAVAPDGAVAVHGNSGVARWDSNGSLTWSVQILTEDLHGVAIDPHGVVYAAADGSAVEALDIRRFAPDGTELSPILEITTQKYGMLAIDPVGRLLVTSSGHSHTDLVSDLPTRSIHTNAFGDAPNGVAAAASDIAWFRVNEDFSFGAQPWTLDRIHAGGATESFSGFYQVTSDGPLGTQPGDIAGALDGRVALVGGFQDVLGTTRGWVTVYGP